MQISVLANVLNVVLNLLFVWGFHLGVGGSACATMLARAFAMIAVLYELRKPVWGDSPETVLFDPAGLGTD